MFLHRHGLVEERLEALSQNEIDTMANLLYLDWSKGKTALVKQLRKSCEQYTNGMPDSSDSPNTGEGFASASQTSQQDLFGFAKRRKSGAPNTSSEDEPDAEPQDDTPGGTWCREPSKEKESCGQDATLIKSGASFFFLPIFARRRHRTGPRPRAKEEKESSPERARHPQDRHFRHQASHIAEQKKLRDCRRTKWSGKNRHPTKGRTKSDEMFGTTSTESNVKNIH